MLLLLYNNLKTTVTTVLKSCLRIVELLFEKAELFEKGNINKRCFLSCIRDVVMVKI
jgi:hypothetical protein